jgi:hypothetical protein
MGPPPAGITKDDEQEYVRCHHAARGEWRAVMAAVIEFPGRRRPIGLSHLPKRKPLPNHALAYRVIPMTPNWEPGVVANPDDPHELARECRRLAARCEHLATVAHDLAFARAVEGWGDKLMAKADELDKAGAAGDCT